MKCGVCGVNSLLSAWRVGVRCARQARKRLSGEPPRAGPLFKCYSNLCLCGTGPAAAAGEGGQGSGPRRAAGGRELHRGCGGSGNMLLHMSGQAWPLLGSWKVLKPHRPNWPERNQSISEFLMQWEEFFLYPFHGAGGLFNWTCAWRKPAWRSEKIL